MVFSTTILLLLTTRFLASNVRYGGTTYREHLHLKRTYLEHFSLANSVQNCIYAAWSLERLGAVRFLPRPREGGER